MQDGCLWWPSQSGHDVAYWPFASPSGLSMNFWTSAIILFASSSVASLYIFMHLRPFWHLPKNMFEEQTQPSLGTAEEWFALSQYFIIAVKVGRLACLRGHLSLALRRGCQLFLLSLTFFGGGSFAGALLGLGWDFCWGLPWSSTVETYAWEIRDLFAHRYVCMVVNASKTCISPSAKVQDCKSMMHKTDVLVWRDTAVRYVLEYYSSAVMTRLIHLKRGHLVENTAARRLSYCFKSWRNLSHESGIFGCCLAFNLVISSTVVCNTSASAVAAKLMQTTSSVSMSAIGKGKSPSIAFRMDGALVLPSCQATSFLLSFWVGVTWVGRLNNHRQHFPWYACKGL